MIYFISFVSLPLWFHVLVLVPNFNTSLISVFCNLSMHFLLWKHSLCVKLCVSVSYNLIYPLILIFSLLCIFYRSWECYYSKDCLLLFVLSFLLATIITSLYRSFTTQTSYSYVSFHHKLNLQHRLSSFTVANCS